MVSCTKDKKQLSTFTSGIDSLFEQCDTEVTPGVAVAIIKDGIVGFEVNSQRILNLKFIKK